MIFDTLERLSIYECIVPELEEIRWEMQKEDFLTRGNDTFYTEGGTRYFIQSFLSDPGKDIYEIHERFIDVQIVLEGREMFFTTSYTESIPSSFEKETDFGALFLDSEETGIILTPGRFALVFPGEPHKPGVSYSNKPEKVRKAVFKIPYQKQ